MLSLFTLSAGSTFQNSLAQLPTVENAFLSFTLSFQNLFSSNNRQQPFAVSPDAEMSSFLMILLFDMPESIAFFVCYA